MSTRHWLLFVSHLPSKESAARMRVWRGLRSAGAAILRDGVYLLPESPQAQRVLEEHASTIRDAGGTAHVLASQTETEGGSREFREMFDREADYAGWHQDAAEFSSALSGLEEAQARRQEAVLSRALDAIVDVDFFPGLARDTACRVMAELSGGVNARFSPDEPSATAGAVPICDRDRYRSRLWVTRQGLWADRVASAWRIRRFIDPRARFRWLASPGSRPDDSVGFDFDGAEFSHVESKVTFEVLMHAFALSSDPALARIGALIHYLDVGGAPIPEGPGLLALLAGAKDRCPGDTEFLDAASLLLDDLYSAFTIPQGATT